VAEIGGYRFFADAHPAGTDLFWSSTRPPPDTNRALTPAALVRLMRDLHARKYDMVVIHPALYPPWHPRTIAHICAHWKTRAAQGLFAAFAMRLVHRFHDVPIAAIDFGDTFGVQTHNLGLIDAVHTYFKRELPADHWIVFHRSGHPRTPGVRFRGLGKWKRRIERLRPLSLGQPWMPPARVPVEKETDIFFAGTVENNSTVRSAGLAELRVLADEGFRVDIATEPLPREDYLDRMGRAWLAWSPGGLGWDCYRHYEAARVNTVPLMNYPTVLQHAPFVDGVHCFYYAPQPGGLSATVRRALENTDRLLAMAREAAELVERHHTVRARADHVAVTVLGRHIDGRLPAASPGPGAIMAPAQS
jgi:hypothetical protein